MPYHFVRYRHSGLATGISLAAGFCLLLSACGGAKVTHQSDIGSVPTMRPTTIYVANFDLDVGEIKSQGIVSSVTGVLPHPLGLFAQDKQTTANELVETMA